MPELQFCRKAFWNSFQREPFYDAGFAALVLGAVGLILFFLPVLGIPLAGKCYKRSGPHEQNPSAWGPRCATNVLRAARGTLATR